MLADDECWDNKCKARWELLVTAGDIQIFICREDFLKGYWLLELMDLPDDKPYRLRTRGNYENEFRQS